MRGSPLRDTRLSRVPSYLIAHAAASIMPPPEVPGTSARYDRTPPRPLGDNRPPSHDMEFQMRIFSGRPMHYAIGSLLMSAALFASPSIASAQGFGIGARMAWVTADSKADVDSVRFIGGQIRLLSKRWGLEVAMDRHSESFELLNQKV